MSANIKKTEVKLAYRMMLDGTRTGLTLDGERGMSIPIRDTEVKRIKKLIRGMDTTQLTNLETWTHIPPPKGGSVGMHLVLRKDRDKDSYYLNLDGNPTTFFNANNDYGYPDTAQVTEAFWYCMQYVERHSSLDKRFPSRLRKAIRDREISVNSLEFALYTEKCTLPMEIIRTWRWVYQTPFMGDQGPRSFASLLRGVSFRQEDYTDEWQEFRVSTKSSANIDRMFCAYYKAEQIEAVQGRAAPDDLQGRIRFDLGLTKTWFKDRRLHTLQDLEDFVARNGGWATVLLKQTEAVMEKCALRHMFTVTTDQDTWDTARYGADAHWAMINGRAEMGFTTERKVKSMVDDNGRSYVEMYRKQALLVRGEASRLSLDLSPVRLEQ